MDLGINRSFRNRQIIVMLKQQYLTETNESVEMESEQIIEQ